MNDDVEVEFQRQAAKRYYDHLLAVMTTAIESGNATPEVCVATLLAAAGVIAAGHVGDSGAATMIELKAHELAERLRSGAPTLN